MGSHDAELTLVLKARNLASKDVDRLHSSLGRIHGSARKAGGAIFDFGKTAALVGLGAVTALAGALAYATKQAADEQVGIAKLGAALKANVPHFKGNTDAIEAYILKQERLAFADDAVRESLSFLVTKYHDVAKAEKINSLAQDVARLKGIGLKDSAVLVSKAMDGNAKALKALGIVLPKTATEQQRMTAIQKAAAGQAEAYGKTAVGAQEAFQVAVGNVVEDIGSSFLPIMTAAFTWLRQNAIPAVRGIMAAIGKWTAENKPLIHQVGTILSGALKLVAGRISDVVTWIGNFVGAIASNKEAMGILRTVAQGIADAFSLAWTALGNVAGAIGRMVAVFTSNKAAMDTVRTTFKLIGDAIGAIVDALRWIIDNAGKALDTLGKIGSGPGSGLKPGHTYTGRAAGNATGGWVGLNGPEYRLVGESGPEYVSSNHASGPGATVNINSVFPPSPQQAREIARMVDRELFSMLQRAAPTAGRT